MSLLQDLIASHLTVRRSLSGFEHISSPLVHPPSMAMYKFERIIQNYRERKIAPRTPQTIMGGLAWIFALLPLFPRPISIELAFYDLITTKNSELDNLKTDYWKAGKSTAMWSYPQKKVMHDTGCCANELTQYGSATSSQIWY
jgi:hypothetical protein